MKLYQLERGGTEGSPIEIKKGRDIGHNGDVIIDGQNKLEALILFYQKHYVNVSYFTLKDTAMSEGGRGIDIGECSFITIDHVKIHVSGRAGIFIEESEDCIIKYNDIDTYDYVAYQTDGIYSQRNSRNTYENNKIVINNSDADGHNDGIQSYMDNSLVIRGNYIEQDNSKTVNAQGIYCTTLSGTFEIYNNVVYAPNTYNSLIALKIPSPSFHAIILSNTLIGGKWGTLKVEGDDNAIIKNNIVWDYNGGVPLTYSGNTTNVTSNLLYSDPLFDTNFMPQENSPALDMGENLDAPYNIDKTGSLRPKGKGFDIGAYERPVDTIEAPKGLRVVE